MKIHIPTWVQISGLVIAASIVFIAVTFLFFGFITGGL